MNEQSQPKNKNSFNKTASDSEATLQKMQNQLDSMERKLDLLLKQSGPRDFKSKYPSNNRREYDDSKRPYKQKYAKRSDEVRSEGKFYYGLPTSARKSPNKNSYGSKKSSPKK